MSGQIPQGIEVLVHKAAVDADFKQLLLQRRSAAAAVVGLELTAAEAMMLAAVPAAQLEAVIARTSVPQEHRRAFLGQAAAAMLAALGAVTAAPALAQQGIGTSLPPPTKGIRPDLPPLEDKKEKTVEQRVMELISNRTGVEAKRIKRDNTLVKDLGAKPADLVKLRKDLEKRFDIKVPGEAFKKLRTVGDVVDCVEKALKKKAEDALKNEPAPKPPYMFGGVRPDLPSLGPGGGKPAQ